jgi:hypothetical protein
VKTWHAQQANFNERMTAIYKVKKTFKAETKEKDKDRVLFVFGNKKLTHITKPDKGTKQRMTSLLRFVLTSNTKSTHDKQAPSAGVTYNKHFSM